MLIYCFAMSCLRELKLPCTIIAISKTKNQEIVVVQMSYLEIWRKALKETNI